MLGFILITGLMQLPGIVAEIKNENVRGEITKLEVAMLSFKPFCHP